MDRSRTGTQVVRVGVAEVDELVLDGLRDLRAFDNRVDGIFSREQFIDVTAVNRRLLNSSISTYPLQNEKGRKSRYAQHSA